MKHFINIIYVVVIMTLAAACAEPYDNEILEDTYEESEGLVEDIGELTDLINEVNKEPVEIIEESIEIIEGTYEVAEDTYNEDQSTSDKLNAIIDDFMQSNLNEYNTIDHFNLPNFCSVTNGPLGQFAYLCSMPRFFDIDYRSAVDALGDLYDSSIEYCAESYSKDCSAEHVNDVIIVATIMQRLGLLPTNCDSSIGEAHVFCDHGGRVQCEQLTPEYTEYTEYTRQIDEIEPLCNMPDTYQRNDGQYYVVNSYNGITIRMY